MRTTRDDAVSDETLWSEAAVRALIDRAVVDVNFTNLSPPEYSAVNPYPRQVPANVGGTATADATPFLPAVLANRVRSVASGGMLRRVC